MVLSCTSIVISIVVFMIFAAQSAAAFFICLPSSFPYFRHSFLSSFSTR